jgi:ureidoglycolate lyase
MPPFVTSPIRRVSLEPLTAEAFQPFGTVIENTINLDDSNGEVKLPPNAVYANQGSAIKVLDVTKMTDYYDEAPSRSVSKAVMNMFICAPRQLRNEHGNLKTVSVSYNDALHSHTLEGAHFYDVKILERHPFTFQTFVPMSLDKTDSSTCYLVIVAPTLPAPEGSPASTNFLDRARASLSTLGAQLTTTTPRLQSHAPPRKGNGDPDLANLRAFLARGDQSVTYTAGTWHAPMVVLGSKSVDFVVSQFANGVGLEDCQEMEIHTGSGASEAISVVIPASTAGFDKDVRPRL